MRYFIRAFSLFLMFLLQTQLYAKEVKTVTIVEGAPVVLTTDIDYHVTALSGAMTTTISLNNEEAWLFFDNIRPDDVIKDYVGRVKINGKALQPNLNARVSIYLHGTVIIPHSTDFEPLKVFKERKFQGECASYKVHVYNNSLGVFDDNIRSFKLKRGYMATFANNADGTGYSRVFIADKKDLEISAMQVELDAKVSFIRVFKWDYVSKKGWCQTGNSKTACDQVGATWFYSWSADQNSNFNQEYTVIKQNFYWPGWGEIGGKENVTHLLGYNEPDHTEQSNVSVDAAVAAWPDMLKSGLRVGAPATTNFSWLYDFMDKCKAKNYRVDFVAVHAYWGGKSPQNWYNDLKYIHERTGRPLWITEWNNGANWTHEWWPATVPEQQQKQLNDLKAILNVLDTAHFVERYSVYNWVEDKRAIILNGALTPAGVYHRDTRPPFAYDARNEVVPVFTMLTPKLLAVLKPKDCSVILSWTTENGDMATKYILERKINNGNFEPVAEFNDISVSNYIDKLNLSGSAELKYRIKVIGEWSNEITSEEQSISVFYSTVCDKMQFSKAIIPNGNWYDFYLGATPTQAPAIIIGAYGYKNFALAGSYCVKNITTSSFQFKFNPWDYLGNKTITSPEEVPYVVFNKGNSIIGSLSYEAGEVQKVSSDWVSVTFSKPFELLPVVFVTPMTSVSGFPVYPRVRNITNTGFEVRLTREEEKTGTYIGENINYLAITPGKTQVDGVNIEVDRTPDAKVAELTKYHPLNVNEKEQLVIAGMQTSNDETTSVLRYYAINPTTVRLFRQREKSVSSTSMKGEQVGWILITKNDQSSIESIKNDANKLIAYVSEDRLALNRPAETRVTVYNISGLQLLNTLLCDAVDIRLFPKGYYILRTDKGESLTFIK